MLIPTALGVGIFNAQQEHTVGMTGGQRIEQGGTDVTEMDTTRRAGRETGLEREFGHGRGEYLLRGPLIES